MNLGKINFFKRIYLAITDFRMYPYAQKEKLTTAIGYFLKLIIFISLILGVFVANNLFEKIPIVLDIYNRYMPHFEIENGVLKAEEVISKEINDEYFLIVNSDYAYNEIQNINITENEIHNYYILVLSDATILSVRMNNGIHEIGRLQYETSMSFNKEQLANECETLIESSVSKIMIWIGMSIGIFIVLGIIRLWMLVMYIFSAYVINFMFGLRLKLIEYLKVVIYASTLPSILEIIAIVLVGNISETVNFLSILISCVYIFYALRAIKIDSLILGGSGKTAEEKIKNALAHAQEELEKQLSEIEQKEDDDKKDEKKEIEELGKELKIKEENLIKAQREYQEIIKKAMNVNNENKSTEKDEENKVKNDENNDSQK